MNNVLVSIIIPVYNTDKYLRQCVDSVLNQTFKDYEVILVNDGSTDKSKDICEEYCTKFNNIKLINQENKGLSATRNRGMQEVVGQYIYFLDSDDIIDKSLLEICYNTAIKDDIEVLLFGYNYISEEGIEEHLNNVKVTLDFIEPNKVFTGKEIMKQDSLNRLSSACTKFYKKSFLVDNNLFFIEGILYEDSEFVPRLLTFAKKVMNINMQLYMYRRRRNSITTSTNYDKHVLSLSIIIDNLFLLLKKEYAKDEILTRNLKKYINEFFKKKVSYYSIMLASNLQNKMNIKESIKLEFEEYFNKYMDTYSGCLLEEDLNFFAEQIVRLGKIDICQYILDDSKQQEYESVVNDIKKIVNRADKIRDNVFKEIPLQDGEKIIGIYGISNHTKALINYYKKNFGDICAKVFFIDSFKGKNHELFEGIEIINVEDIEKIQFKAIVLSSYNSENQLLQNINKYNINEVPVYRFYEDNNILLFG